MSAGKLNVYNLGKLGVVIDKTPLHTEDGELSKAQNAIRDASGSDGALRKRQGLTKLNAVALAGSVFGIINVPIAQVATRSFLIGVDQDNVPAYQWRTSTNEYGTNTTATTPSAANSGTGMHVKLDWYGRAVQWNGVFFYPALHTGKRPTLNAWDGAIDRELFQISANPNEYTAGLSVSNQQISHMIIDGTKIYFSVTDASAHPAPDYHGRVFQYDLESGALVQMGQTIGSETGGVGDGEILPLALCMYQGYLYCAMTYVTSGAGGVAANNGIYRIKPGVETTWTQDFIGDGTEAIYSMAVYKGLLYAGTTAISNVKARVLVRGAAGTWTESTNSGGVTAGAGSTYSELVVFGDNLYAGRYRNNTVTFEDCDISKYDGTTWTASVKNFGTAGANSFDKVTASVIENNKLYMLAGAIGANNVNALVTYTTDGITWTDVTGQISATNIFGVMVL